MARYRMGNITIENISEIFNNIREGSYKTHLYKIFKNLDGVDSLIPKNIFKDKDKLDNFLYELFDVIIKNGRKCYSIDKRYDSTLNESNYLKKDNNYYSILKAEWDAIEEKTKNIFDKYMKNI